MKTVFHITDQTAWEAAQKKGEYHHPSLETEGFIHFSKKEQLLQTAERFFAGQDGLVLLEVAADRLHAPLKEDWVESRGENFAHLYGPLNLDAVVATHPFSRGTSGEFTLPPQV